MKITTLRKAILAMVTVCAMWGGMAVAEDIQPGNQADVVGGLAADNSAVTITVLPTGDNPVTHNGQTVISHGNNATVVVQDGAVVQGNSNVGYGVAGGFNTGPNVIELRSDSVVTVNGRVEQLGNTTNGEAINFHGTGNLLTISRTGSVYSQNGAAIWFQDVYDDGSGRNIVVNYGTIATGKGASFNVFGSSAGSGAPGLDFTNYGSIDGSLRFGNGDDRLTLGVDSAQSNVPRPIITGNVDGGGGDNTLILTAVAGEAGELTGAVKNFSSLTKTGAGNWAILGQVPITDGGEYYPPSPVTGSLSGVNSLSVQQGELELVGANPDFNGTVEIYDGGTLNVQAQGIDNANGSIANGGTLLLNQPFDDTFSKTIVDKTGDGAGSGRVVKIGAGTLTLAGANTYSGGTFIDEGTLAISNLDNIGSGGVQFLESGNTVTAATLRILDDIDLSGRSMTIETASGATDDTSFGIVDTNGHDFTTDVIDGTGSLVKTGAGTMNITGASTYGGTTNLQGGMLNIADTADVSETSAVNVYGGTLRVLGAIGTDTTPASTTTTVYQGSNLDGYGDGAATGVVRGNVTNFGTITPGILGDDAENAAQGRALTITGDYASSGGPPSRVNIATELGDDSSNTSQLNITGTATGFTWVNVANQGGAGDNTNVGIDVITTGNSDNAEFRLRGNGYLPDGTPIVTAGDYGYSLVKGGIGGNSDDWYLVAIEHNGMIITPPHVTVFDTAALAATPFNLVGTLMQRVGNRTWAGGGQRRDYLGGTPVSSTDAYASQTASEHRFLDKSGLWTRLEGALVSLKPRTTDSHQGKSEIDYWRAEVGFDTALWRPSAGSALIAGISGHFASSDNTIKDMTLQGARGSIKSDGYGVGASLTFYGEYGFYADAVARFTWYDSDIKATYGPEVHRRDGNDGFGHVYSLEVGQTFSLPHNFSLTPQVQYVHSVIDTDSFRDQFGDRFSYKNTVGKLLRMGVAANREWSFCSPGGSRRRLELYGVANLYREFDAKTEMKHYSQNMGTVTTYRSTAEKWWAGGSVGATYDWADSKYSIYGEVGYRATFKQSGQNNILHGEAGFRINF